MTRCPTCTREQADEHLFCPYCGASLTAPGVLPPRQGVLDATDVAGNSPPEPERSVSRALGLPFLLVLALAVLVLGGAVFAETHPSPAAAVPLPTATSTRLATATATLVPTATATPFSTATPAPTETATLNPTATWTPVPTATAPPPPTATPRPTATPVPYRTEQFQVPPGVDDSITYTIQHPPGRFTGYVLILGANNDIGFRLRAPSGGYLIKQSRVANRYAFDLTLPDAGPYTLFLDNSFSLITTKDVTMYSRLVGGDTGP